MTATKRARQRGFSLLEGLIAILVFSLGALGAIEMQARAIQLGMDSQDRADAVFLVNRLISDVSLQDATPAMPDPSSNFLLAETRCGETIPPAHPATAWIAEICAAFDDATITIARPAGVSTGFLTVTVAWSGRYKSSASDGDVARDLHRHSVTTRFQWQS